MYALVPSLPAHGGGGRHLPGAYYVLVWGWVPALPPHS